MKTNRKNIWKLLAPFFFLFTGFACSEDYRMHSMVDDQIYVLKTGVVFADMFLWDDYVYDFIVIKSGMGQQEAEVELLIDESLLATYNASNGTNYSLLPPSYYTVKSEKLRFGASEYRKSFPIAFDLKGMQELQNKSASPYVLPCKLNVINSSAALADSERMSAILVPVIKKPYLEFDRNYMTLSSGELSQLTVSIDKRSKEEVQQFVEIKTNYPNSSGLSFTLTVDPSLLEKYNSENNASYKILPETAYSFDSSQWEILANQTFQPLEFKIFKKGLFRNDQPMYGNYILPLRISSVSIHGINPEQAVLFLPVSFNPDNLDRTGWEIIEWNSCISEEPHYESLERTPEKMLDGNTSTFWGSKWDEPKPLPYYFIFDMKQSYKIYRIGITKPSQDAWRGNIKSGYVEISQDNRAWVKLLDWVVESNTPREHHFAADGSQARYIRFVISDVFAYFNPEIGADSGANCDIAEFHVWGE